MPISADGAEWPKQTCTTLNDPLRADDVEQIREEMAHLVNAGLRGEGWVCDPPLTY